MRLVCVLTCFVLAFLVAEVGFAQISLSGVVQDESTGEVIILGNVALYHDSIFLKGMETDFDGNYEFRDLDPGTYEVEVSQHVSLDIGISDQVIISVCYVYRPPMIEFDAFTQGHTLTLRDSGVIETSSMILRE